MAGHAHPSRLQLDHESPVLSGLALLVFLLTRLFPGLADKLSIVHEEEDGRYVAGVIDFFLAPAALLPVEVIT